MSRSIAIWILAVVVTICITAKNAAFGDDAVNGSLMIYQGVGEYMLAPRNALVIGVSALKNGNGFTSLKNPANDAKAVADALRKEGFSVINLDEEYAPSEMTRQNIKRAIYDFAALLRSVGGVGLLYFSGHGIERDGHMYLFPYDAYVQYSRDFDEELIPLSLIYDAFSFAGSDLNFVVVDACRDFPYHGTLAEFGSKTTESVSHAASQNVIQSNSTLSGSTALDGTGNLSPYASAFVSAVTHESDKGLGEFFGAIGREIHRIYHSDPKAEIPNTTLIDGRDFVFLPTAVSFSKEKEIFDTGVSTGNRDILTDLMWEYSGGYFYSAAKKWLDNAPLAPAILTPSRGSIKVVQESNLRSGPGLDSEVVSVAPRGMQLPITGEVAARLGSYWYPTLNPDTGVAAFVRTDRVQLLDSPLAPETVALSFAPAANGQSDAISAESLAQLKHAIAAHGGSAQARAQVVGYSFGVSDGKLSNRQSLLDRQAKAVQALDNLGYDASKANVTVREPAEEKPDGSVEVIIY